MTSPLAPSRSTQPPSATAACLIVFSILALAQATWINWGRYDPRALAWIAAAITAAAGAVFWRPRAAVERFAANLLPSLAAAVGLIEFLQLPSLLDYFRYPQVRPLVGHFVQMALLLAVVAVPILLGRPRHLLWAATPILLTLYALMALWYLHFTPHPHVDTVVIETRACQELMAGRNPYRMTFPDIYGPNSGYYPPGTVVNGEVRSGYCYPPLSLLMILPGYWAGDVRYAEAAAAVLAAAVMAYGVGPRAAVLFVLFPRGFYVLENAYVDPLMLLCATLTIASARRWPKALPISLGLLLAVKQYALIALPALWLISDRPWRVAAQACIVAAVVTLPMALWDVGAFAHSLTAIHFGHLRLDALSFNALVARTWAVHVPVTAALALALAVGVAAAYRGVRSPTTFVAAMGLIYLVLFSWGELAFTNYYWCAAGILCCGAGVKPLPSSATSARRA